MTILGIGMELDAIAAVVIGGTLLIGGAGSVSGTLCGVLLLGVIQNLINQIGNAQLLVPVRGQRRVPYPRRGRAALSGT